MPHRQSIIPWLTANAGGARLLAMQICAVAALLALGGYQVMRLAAAQCNGVACDWYIAPSVLLPLLVLALVGATGALAITVVLRRPDVPDARSWLIVMIAATVLGVAGPFVSLAVLRDSPDALVVIGTVLYMLAPIAALAYSWVSRR
jgi:hypothetical protein